MDPKTPCAVMPTRPCVVWNDPPAHADDRWFPKARCAETCWRYDRAVAESETPPAHSLSVSMHAERGEPCPSCGEPVTVQVRITGLTVPDIDRWVCAKCSPAIMRPQPGSISLTRAPGPAEHVCDQTQLVVVTDDEGEPDHEVCPVCGLDFW